jgi:hypothetical protein
MTKVYFQKSNLTIQIESDDGKDWLYEVDLENCTDSAQILDYILQIADKDWCTPQILYDLIKEIEKASREVHRKNAQGVFCPLGENQKVSWVRSNTTKG